MNRLGAAILCASVLHAAGAHAAELGDLLRATLDHPAVQARSLEARAAQDELAAATRRYLGSGGFNADAARYEDQRFAGILSPAAFVDPPFAQTLSRYGVSYSVPVDLFGVVAASRQAAKSNLAAAQLLERQEILLKLHTTTEAYSRLQALQIRRAAVQAQRARVDTTLDRTRQEVQVELASGTDLKLTESESARTTSDEVRLRGMIEATRAALREATGQTVPTAQPPGRIPPWPASAPDEALPVQLAKARAAATSAQAREAHRSLLPSISVVADYTQFEGAGGIPEAWAVGARFTVPLDFAAYQRANALDARARAAARRQAAAESELTRQWTELESAYRSALADLAAAEQEIAARSEVVTVQTELQRVGITSMEDLLRQQRDLVEAQSRRADAHARAMQAWSAAQVVLGAGAQEYIEQLEAG